MAENAVHISSLLQSKPSIFELIAQDSLLKTLRPSLRLICHILGTKYSQHCWLINWFEECYLCFSFCVQFYYLKAFSASFSEAFYGLRRVCANRPEHHTLSCKQLCYSLFGLVFFPYLRKKIEIIVNNYDSKSLNSNFRAILIKLFKIINFNYELSTIIYYIGYLSGKFESYSPLLTLSGIQLIHQQLDLSNEMSYVALFKSLFNIKYFVNCRALVKLVFKLLTDSLEIGAFFIQFLQWWHLDEVGIKLNKHPAPIKYLVKENKVLKNVCPLCHEFVKMEVVLQTSGYVFCYQCVKKWLDTHKRCPISFIPSKSNDLIRLYPVMF